RRTPVGMRLAAIHFIGHGAHPHHTQPMRSLCDDGGIFIMHHAHWAHSIHLPANPHLCQHAVARDGKTLRPTPAHKCLAR
ncbi:MAG: hypothetical protein ACK48C_12645, partial [Roseiflexaceae bacterium]